MALVNTLHTAITSHPYIATIAVASLAIAAICKGVSAYNLRALEKQFCREYGIELSDFDKNKETYTNSFRFWYGDNALRKISNEAKATSHGKTNEQILINFINIARRSGFVYRPMGAHCGVIAKHFQGVLGEGEIHSRGNGGNRVVIHTPFPIDPKWKGGPVQDSTRTLIPNWAGFENHVAVRVGNRIYDPTGGYVGDEDGWYRLLTPTKTENLYTFDPPLPARRETGAEIIEAGLVKITRLRNKVE